MRALRRTLLGFFAGLSLSIVTGLAGAEEAPHVSIKTSMGDIVIELYPEKAPKTVQNFLDYVKSGHYKGTIFHRVIDDFMIQGGGFDKNMKQKPTKNPIQNEASNGLKNERYTVAMARTGFPHSATSQFFINVNDNAFLDYPGRDGWGYCVFGKVIKGMEVVDQIKKVETTTHDMNQNVPVKPIVIESATIVK
jgi:cyclophilin family peptidyl-prolyl cis-trans isomerase